MHRTSNPIILALAPLALLLACGDSNPPKPDPDPVAPGRPAVDPAPSLTNQNPLRLEGAGQAGATLQVRGGSAPVASIEVGSNGRFALDVGLKPDSVNMLLVSQAKDGLEGPAVSVQITHDGTSPDNPRLDPVTSPTRRSRVVLTGSTESRARITVSGGAEEASSDADGAGRFSVEVMLRTELVALTENALEVVASDAAGNLSAATRVSIVHNPTLPIEAPEVDALPRHTNQASQTIVGLSEPGVSISVSGGAETVNGVAGSDGRFSIGVALRPNSQNTLNVFAVIAATGQASPPRSILVTHDDIAPSEPELDAIGSPTGATTVTVTGRTEAFARLSLSGGLTDTATIADADGEFSMSVELNADQINTLRVSASDLAGNTGPAAMLSIEQDSSLEAPVTLDPVVSPTSENPITLRGSAEPSVDLNIEGGASAVSVTTAADGSFSAVVTLRANANNQLRISRVGSNVATLVAILHDDIAPSPPSLDALASPTNETNLNVSGSSEPNARISVSGGVSSSSGIAPQSGRFSVAVSIAADAEATLSVIATDRAGNSSAPATVRVTHSSSVPDAPVLDETSPEPTNEATYLVSGHVTAPGAAISIRIRGGASEATGDTDPSTGAFSIEVTLLANQSSELEVVSMDGLIESSPALVTVIHDDIAPAAPAAAQISLGRPALAGCLTRAESINVTGGLGSVEGFARVRVLNATQGSIASTVDAQADGSFVTSLLACDGDLLRLTASDAAGNTSLATEMTVMN